MQIVVLARVDDIIEGHGSHKASCSIIEACYIDGSRRRNNCPNECKITMDICQEMLERIIPGQSLIFNVEIPNVVPVAV